MRPRNHPISLAGAEHRKIVGQALRLPSDWQPDPSSFHCGATSAVALQLNNAHNLRVSEFQFGGVALAKAGDSFMLFV